MTRTVRALGPVRRNHLSRPVSVAATAAAAVAVLTCSSPTAPVFVALELGSIVVHVHQLDAARLLEISAAPADTSIRLPQMHRLRAQVNTSGGDLEEVSFAPQLCDGDYLCHSLVVSMDEGRDIKELEPLFTSLPARLQIAVVFGDGGDTVHVSKRLGAIWAFDPMDVPGLTRLVSGQPGVALVGRNGVGWIGPPIRWRILALRPAERSVVVPGDGTLQFQTGDTVTVRYTQPDGSALTASAVVP